MHPVRFVLFPGLLLAALLNSQCPFVTGRTSRKVSCIFWNCVLAPELSVLLYWPSIPCLEWSRSEQTRCFYLWFWRDFKYFLHCWLNPQSHTPTHMHTLSLTHPHTHTHTFEGNTNKISEIVSLERTWRKDHLPGRTHRFETHPFLLKFTKKKRKNTTE